MTLRAALVLLLLGSTAARAETGEGKEQFQRARVAFEAAQFAEAARLFEAAYAASNHPQILWNIAQSYRRLFEVGGDPGSLRRAREVYRNYSELAETEKERADGQREMEATDALLHELDRKAEAERREKEKRDAPPPVVATPAPAESPPIYRRWWFWTAIAALAVAGAATGIAVALTSDRTPASAGGNWAPFGLVVWP